MWQKKGSDTADRSAKRGTQENRQPEAEMLQYHAAVGVISETAAFAATAEARLVDARKLGNTEEQQSPGFTAGRGRGLRITEIEVAEESSGKDFKLES